VGDGKWCSNRLEDAKWKHRLLFACHEYDHACCMCYAVGCEQSVYHRRGVAGAGWCDLVQAAPVCKPDALPAALLFATGPLSNLAYALDRYPEVADRIGMVYWMGGALRVKGNVYQPHTDGSAEWNAYWDPAAMGVVWRSSVPLTLVPLDGTNKVRAARCQLW
jgi:hypothetical protein